MVILSVDKCDEKVLLELDSILSGAGSFYYSEGIDAVTVVNYIVKITEVIAPLIAGYIIGLQVPPKITITYKGKVDAKISMAIRKRNIKQMELAALMIEKFNDTISAGGDTHLLEVENEAKNDSETKNDN